MSAIPLPCVAAFYIFRMPGLLFLYKERTRCGPQTIPHPIDECSPATPAPVDGAEARQKLTRPNTPPLRPARDPAGRTSTRQTRSCAGERRRVSGCQASVAPLFGSPGASGEIPPTLATDTRP